MTKINPALASLVVPITSLTPDPRNARLHPDRNRSAIRASLERHGQQKPIVVKAGVIVAGNGTWEEAREMGWTEIAVVEFDGDSEALAKAYAIEDNRTAELAEWDLQILGDSLKDLGELNLISSATWADYEIEPLLQADWSPPPPSELPKRDEVRQIRFTNEQWIEVQRVASVVEGRDGKRTIAAIVVDALRRYVTIA